jgi:hypothetical protein
MNRVVTIVLAIVVIFGYIYFSKPKKVVINEKGRIEGLINKGRALLQGNKFWDLQFRMANEIYNKSLVPALPSSAELQELYRKMHEAEIALYEKIKPLYSTEEQMAYSLRMRADSIEKAGKWRVLDDAAEAVRVKETEKYKIIIPLIESRLKGSKAAGKPAL